MPPTSATVLIGNQHPLVGDALARLVACEDGLETIARCLDGQSALATIIDRRPDVAVLGVSLPRRDGPTVARAARHAGAPTGVVFVSSRDDPVTVYRCLAAGARGFVRKTSPTDDVVRAIATVAGGGKVIPEDLEAAFAKGRSLAQRGERLTPRERRVLTLCADGLSVAAIAAELYIEQTTVKTHLRHASDKLGVRGKTAASAMALRNGFIT